MCGIREGAVRLRRSDANAARRFTGSAGSLEFGVIGVPSFVSSRDSARGSRTRERSGGGSRDTSSIWDPAVGLCRGGRRSVPDRAVPRASISLEVARSRTADARCARLRSGTGAASPSRARGVSGAQVALLFGASPRRSALLRGSSGVSWRDAPDGAARSSRRDRVRIVPRSRHRRARGEHGCPARGTSVRNRSGTRRFRTVRASTSGESRRSSDRTDTPPRKGRGAGRPVLHRRIERPVGVPLGSIRPLSRPGAFTGS
jgi:hypothetical protein